MVGKTQSLVILCWASAVAAWGVPVPQPGFGPGNVAPRDVAARVDACRAARGNVVFPERAPTPGGVVRGERPEGLTTNGYLLAIPRQARSDAFRRSPDNPGRITYAYDNMNRRTSMIADILANPVSYQYDALGRLESITDHTSETYTFAYDDLDRRAKLTRPSGVTTDYAYDEAGRLVSVQHSRPDGRLVVTPSGVPEQGLKPSRRTQVIGKAEYTYDTRGRRTSMTNSAGTHSYTYDDTGQLLTATHPDQPDEAFEYDALGNHVAAGDMHNAANRLLEDAGFAYAYDDNGCLTDQTPKGARGSTTYDWDEMDRLTAVALPDGTQVTFAYRFDGQRTSQTTADGTARYVYDGEDIIAMLDEAGNLVRSFTHGPGIDEPLAVHGPGGTRHYLADAHGSPQALVDDTGAVVESYRYSAFGQTTVLDAGATELNGSVLGNPYGFTGRELDSTTGLCFYRARYYDPALRRFLSEDPIGLAGGVNLYAYVGNGPVDWRDPLGWGPSAGGDGPEPRGPKWTVMDLVGLVHDWGMAELGQTKLGPLASFWDVATQEIGHLLFTTEVTSLSTWHALGMAGMEALGAEDIAAFIDLATQEVGHLLSTKETTSRDTWHRLGMAGLQAMKLGKAAGRWDTATKALGRWLFRR